MDAGARHHLRWGDPARLAAYGWKQPRERERGRSDEAPGVSVVDKGVSSDATVRIVHLAKVTWLSRVSETSTDARAVLAERDETWQPRKMARCMGPARS
jgi:hypothetical protein